MTFQTVYSTTDGVIQLLGPNSGEGDRPWVPDPLDSDVQSARFHHLDVAHQDGLDLEAELTFLLCVHHLLSENSWEIERIGVLRDELSARNLIPHIPHGSADRRRQRLSQVDSKDIASVDEFLASENDGNGGI